MMQLDFFRRLLTLPGREVREPNKAAKPSATALDAAPLQARARELVLALGRKALAERLQVRWNSRMRSTAGTAHHGKWLISLNPRLIPFGQVEVDRTLLHELAHLLAHDRAGKRRIAPHGKEWHIACGDLGLPDEPRCHELPLPRRQLARKFSYQCPACKRVMQRVRPLRRKSACSACCKQHNRGRYHDRFRFVPLK